MKVAVRPFGLVCAAVAAVSAVGWVALRPRSASLPPKGPFATALRASGPSVRELEDRVELKQALAGRRVTGRFVGNGRERMTAVLKSGSKARMTVEIQAGQTFVRDGGMVVTVRAESVMLPPGGTVTQQLRTVAVSTGGILGEGVYEPEAGRSEMLVPLIDYLAKHPEVSVPAAQTAALALTENLPLSAFAKFATATAEMPSQFDTTAFRVEVADIVSALTVLRAIGCRDERIALTVDPQLKIEAMIDPLAHAAAMRYYGIAPAREWEYWRNELQSGDPRTRHYALYGIARFFPEIALEMLPQWAREKRTPTVYRQSAILALAETQRPAAVSVLKQLALELAGDSELGAAAQRAVQVLVARVERDRPASRLAVAFRTSRDLGGL